MTDNYDDIISLPHHRSKVHLPQPMEKRAAQFSPFAALTGYDDAVEETARYTDSKVLLEEEQKASINAVLVSLREKVRSRPSIQIEYYVPDLKKSGGSYRSLTGTVRKIDEQQQQLFLSDGTEIPFDNIISLFELQQRPFIQRDGTPESESL